MASAVVKALASYKCVSGSCLSATPYVVWMGLLLVLAYAGLYPVTLVIRYLKKFPANLIPGIRWVTNNQNYMISLKRNPSVHRVNLIFSGQNPCTRII